MPTSTCLAALGRHDEALQLLAQYEQFAIGIDRPAFETVRAYVLATAGRVEEALALLGDLVERRGDFSRASLKYAPNWDFLRDNPDFRALTEVSSEIR